jgi:D-alanyl-D-alanine carboxypeptidase
VGTERTDASVPVPDNGRFRAGGVTQALVATAVLQLVDEHRLSLDDPAVRFVPEFDLDRRITVRMLLQHTSGIFSYTGEHAPDGKFEPGIPLHGQEYVDNLFRTYHPAELVGLALAQPSRFEPGAQWSHSSTNYVLLGLLIEHLTGGSYADRIRDRILEPLGMTDTTFPGSSLAITGPHAHGYFTYSDGGKTRTVDATSANMSWAFGAADVISTTTDLDRFLAALLNGDLMSQQSLHEMLTMRPVGPGMEFGLGLTRQKLPAPCQGDVIGAGGSVPGYQSFAFSTPDGLMRLVVAIALSTVDITDFDATKRLMTATDALTVAAACHGGHGQAAGGGPDRTVSG